MSDLEQSIKEVLAAGLSTGHADDYPALVRELIAEALMFRGKLEKANRRIAMLTAAWRALTT